MAGLKCTCGNGMWNGEQPNDIEIYMLSDREWDEITERDEHIMLMELPHIIKFEYWRCPECGRISVVNPKNGKKVRVYAIEREIPENDYPKD